MNEKENNLEKSTFSSTMCFTSKIKSLNFVMLTLYYQLIIIGQMLLLNHKLIYVITRRYYMPKEIQKQKRCD